MARPKIIDAFPMNNELDMLQCRLEELYSVVDHFVLVESEQDHQDHVKPLYYAENRERFAPWADKITHVVTGKLPTHDEDNDPWAREHAQREWIGVGLSRLDLCDDDIVAQSDIDEIPRALHLRNVRPAGNMVVFGMRMHAFAVDWLHPVRWQGTVAATIRTLANLPNANRFAYQRDNRLRTQCPPHLRDAGWHFSWIGGRQASLDKLGSFCHPEIAEQTEEWLRNEVFWREGFHVDGQRQTAVDVDDTWPKFIAERRCPDVWFRPR